MPSRIRVDAGRCQPSDGAGGGTAAFLERCVRTVLADRGVEDALISVALLEDDAMADLNARYLERDGTTDVLAFDLSDPEASVVGDIYVGRQQAERQASEHGVPLREELGRLTIHGTLHVLGFDHPEGEDRAESEMWSLQERLLSAALGS